jgi:hypothetical protein
MAPDCFIHFRSESVTRSPKSERVINPTQAWFREFCIQRTALNELAFGDDDSAETGFVACQDVSVTNDHLSFLMSLCAKRGVTVTGVHCRRTNDHLSFLMSLCAKRV